MFGPHSKLILAVPAWFKAHFGCSGLIQGQFWPVSAILVHFSRRPIRPDSGQIGPIRCKSSCVGANPRKRKKKKKLKCGTNVRAATSNAAPHVRLWCSTLPAMSVLQRLTVVNCKLKLNHGDFKEFRNKLDFLKRSWRVLMFKCLDKEKIKSWICWLLFGVKTGNRTRNIDW